MKAVALTVVILLLISPIWAPVVILYVAMGCHYEDLGMLASPVPGMKFVMKDEVCAALFTTPYLNVVEASQKGFAKTVIFGFQPSTPETYPVITLLDERTLLIAVDSVSSLGVQKDEWAGYAIKYRIGRVTSPQPHDKISP